MIINRASIERGFAYGTVYKSCFVDLFTVAGGRKPKNPQERDACDLVFERDPKKPFLKDFLGESLFNIYSLSHIVDVLSFFVMQAKIFMIFLKFTNYVQFM